MPVIHLADYVIDFVCIPNDISRPYEDLKVWVVELNPFAEFAGGGLFKWENNHDNRVLRGLEPFEFRIATEPLKLGAKAIATNWAKYLQTNKS